MVREGVLPPRESGEYIASHAEHVKIHEDGIDNLAKEMLSSISDKLQVPDTGADAIHPSPDNPNAVDWIFVADVLNFCFWSKKNEEKWTVEGQTGYYALEAALARAIREGYDITNPSYYSKITDAQLAHIMRGDNDVKIPLLEKRVTALQEAGKTLLDKYEGTFKTCVKEANNNALQLLRIIVDNLHTFQDEVTYKGKNVALYKRAQILIADLSFFFRGKDWGYFTNIDELTMFADYRVPQVLVYFGAMNYSDQLMKKLENDELLQGGSEEEVEIRGCSIHATELLKKRIQMMLIEKQSSAEPPNSVLIDYYLWCYRRKYADELEKIPFHKTLGIFY